MPPSQLTLDLPMTRIMGAVWNRDYMDKNKDENWNKEEFEAWVIPQNYDHLAIEAVAAYAADTNEDN